MIVDGWRLIVAAGPRLDNERQWVRWLGHQAVPPEPDDVRIDLSGGADGDSCSYWVRGELLLPLADRVVVVQGNYDPKRRKNNRILGKCSDPQRVKDLVDCLATTTGERPHLMSWATPTIAFLSGRSELIGSVSVVEGTFIRSELWCGDAPLVQPDALSEWFAETLDTGLRGRLDNQHP